MTRSLFVSAGLMILISAAALGQPHQTDRHAAAGGDLTITFLGHGSVMLEQANKVVYVDPVSRYADFTQMPKADVILITHEHGDHLDSLAIAGVRNENTTILLTQPCVPFVPSGEIIRNGENRVVKGIRVDAVPAYNIKNKRSNGTPFHPKGVGNGYIIGIGGSRLYFAGDTENIPEMSNLGTIDYAFLPVNLPYTMTPAMVAEAAKRIKPRIFYPYHFGNTDTTEIVKQMSNERAIEVRIRNMK